MQHFAIAHNWYLRQHAMTQTPEQELQSAEGWLPARVPGEVHLDLHAAGCIPEPFAACNEELVQWVGEADWLYRCSFDLPAELLQAPAVDLCFDGLDTFATVWLNGEQILHSDNMFVPQRLRVEALLRSSDNQLVILFESALRAGQERQARYGTRRCWNGDPSRLYVRKAQFHYGWDWGPCLLSAGPWRPVHLETFAARIAELHCPVEVSADLRRAVLPLTARIETAVDLELELLLELRTPDGELLETATLPCSGQELSHRFELDAPRLWWPRGYGAQPRYRLSATLQRRGAPAAAEDRRELLLGLRRLRLLQEPLEAEEGRGFLFEVNNVPLFCGGANWVPADSFVSRIPPERYRALLQQAAEASMTMLRVWGGGIYEHDLFYDLCDELGLLVWQDFMFACGMYPAHQDFLDSVRAEAEAALRRLRHHPSIVLWCGNNEDYSIAAQLGVYDHTRRDNLADSFFPARQIYERLLPEVCAALDPTRPYWPGSPYGGADPQDSVQGDRHTWEIWHSPLAPYQRYADYSGRFVSEFGMAAAPALRTLEAVLPAAERSPHSRAFEHHHKADGGPRRLATYLSDSVPFPRDLDAYSYTTQLVQAEALAAAIRHWRRRWAGRGRYAVSGALIWQLNDCWPTISWAVVDYCLRPKAALYAVRRALAPLAVELAAAAGRAEIWAVNATSEPQELTLLLDGWSLAGEQLLHEERQVALPALRSCELGALALPETPAVLGARLIHAGRVLARAALWPEPFKHYRLPDPELELQRLDDERLLVRARRPAKGVLLDAGDGVRWSDNYFDLLPGDDQLIHAAGLGPAQIEVRRLEV